MGHCEQHILDEIKRRVPVSRVAQRFVKLKRAGREYVGLSPFKRERTPSFTVNDDKGFYHCFATNEHGDAFDLLMKIGGMNFVQAKALLAGMAGIELGGRDETDAAGPSPRPSPRGGEGENISSVAPSPRPYSHGGEGEGRRGEAEAHKEKMAGWAVEIWRGAQPAAGTIVETYLLSRGIDLEALASVYHYRVPPSLRFAPRLYYQRDERGNVIAPPAMVGVVQRADGQISAVHRTWLDESGHGKALVGAAKKTLGYVWGGGIRLSPVSAHCVIGEGVETTLSVMADLARCGESVFGLCGVALGNIAGRGRCRALRRGEPKPAFIYDPDPKSPGLLLPHGVERVTLCADADSKDAAFGVNMMERAANKFRALGVRDVRIAKPLAGCDFNDMAGVGDG